MKDIATLPVGRKSQLNFDEAAIIPHRRVLRMYLIFYRAAQHDDLSIGFCVGIAERVPPDSVGHKVADAFLA
jgi:hypothetical protein